MAANTPNGWDDGGICRPVGSREAVRPCQGFGEAVRGIAGWRAGTGEQGGTGSIPHNTRAHKFYKTADHLKANTPNGWGDGGLCRLSAVGMMAAFAACGRQRARAKRARSASEASGVSVNCVSEVDFIGSHCSQI